MPVVNCPPKVGSIEKRNNDMFTTAGVVVNTPRLHYYRDWTIVPDSGYSNIQRKISFILEKRTNEWITNLSSPIYLMQLDL